ncbi:MAG: ROK family transcriptional regulator [Massiliimalia sp.]|jgi:predicted NBD/HSP70 family sugar kinase
MDEPMQNTAVLEIRRINRRNIFRYIHQKGHTSRQEIALDLHLSMPTVLQNVKELLEQGFVEESGQYQSTGGRKATALSIVPQARLSAGIDLTRNHMSFVLVDLAGTLLSHERISCPFEDSEAYYRKLQQLLEDFLRKHKVDRQKLLGVGISIPGILNPEGTVITDSHALNLQNFPCQKLSSFFPYPCQFVNDANAAGLAELRLMKSDSTMVYLSLSNSVGGAFFLDGKLYPGTHQRSSEFGHMRLYPNGKPCYCGQKGCLDAYCSALTLTTPSQERLDTFFEKLKSQDSIAQMIWEDYLSHLALAVVNLRMCYDCTVILGGYVGAYLGPYLPKLQDMVSHLDPFEGDGSFLQCCQYQYEASACGAAMQPIELFLEQF